MRISRTVMLAIVTFWLYAPFVAASNYPVVGVTKSVSPLGPDQSALDPLDTVTLTIELTGDTRTYPQGVETAVVLVLDESGSMDGEEGFSRSAAKAVISILKPTDKVGLVAFDTGIKSKVNLTTNHTAVSSAIDALDSPDDATNALKAVTEANAMLAADKSAVKRMVIFFTDGVPTPITQMDDILDKTQEMNKAKISYYTVAYRNFLKSWLKQLAYATGGNFCDAGTGGTIATCFTAAFKAGSQTVSAQDVWVHEVLSSDFKAVAGTFSYSTGGSYVPDAPDFKAAMQAAEQKLYTSGVLDTPAIYELPKGRSFTVSFDITPTSCTETVQKLGINNSQATYLEYDFGPLSFKISHPEFNQAFVAVNRCGAYIDKRFEQTNRVITVSLRNAFPDRNIYDVHLTEVVGALVGPYVGSATPASWNGDSRVVFPHYPPNDAWNVNGLEWRLFNGVPVGPNDPNPTYPPFGFKVNSHNYIGPSTEVQFKLPVYAKTEAAGKKNVLINQGWQPAIEGGEEPGSSLTFWYKLPFGAPEPKQEIINGYTFRYSYESISGSSNWSKKRHVVIRLPDLHVASFEPEWPYAPEPLTVQPLEPRGPGLPPTIDPTKLTPRP